VIADAGTHFLGHPLRALPCRGLRGFGLAAPIKLRQDPTPLRALLTGVYAGLAGGAKYIGTLFLPFALAAIWFIPGPRGERRLARMVTVARVCGPASG